MKLPVDSKRKLPEIKPCPFCGGKCEWRVMPWHGQLGYVYCHREKCGARGPKRATQLAAINAWNRRAGDGK